MGIKKVAGRENECCQNENAVMVLSKAKIDRIINDRIRGTIKLSKKGQEWRLQWGEEGRTSTKRGG